MRNISADQLQAFVAVLDAGSFTAAARAVNLTQPAVSLQIRELETRLGVTLIDRSGKRPRPTAAGRDLLMRARRILAEQQELLGDMKRHRDGKVGRVRIGLSTTTLIHIAAKPMREMRAADPHAQVHIRIGTSADSAAAIMDNLIDLAIVTLPVEADDLEITPLLHDDHVAILPAGLPAPQHEATPAFLANQSLIIDERQASLGRMTRRWFEAAGVEPDFRISLGHLEAIKGAVAAGLGAAIVPGILVRSPPDGVIVRALAPRLGRDLAIIERRGVTLPEAAQRMKALFLKHARSLDASTVPTQMPPDAK